MLIGYPISHGQNVFKFYNLETKGILLSHNVFWLNKVYGDYTNTKSLITLIDAYEAENLEASNSPLPLIPPITIDHDPPNLNDFAPVQVTDDNQVTKHDQDDDSTVFPSVRISGLDRNISNLTTYYNPNPRDHMEAAAFSLYETALASQQSVPDMSIFPRSYRDALKRKDHSHWWTAMKSEFHSAESKNVWRIVKKSSLPKKKENNR
jgi:hypothetical protein